MIIETFQIKISIIFKLIGVASFRIVYDKYSINIHSHMLLFFSNLIIYWKRFGLEDCNMLWYRFGGQNFSITWKNIARKDKTAFSKFQNSGIKPSRVIEYYSLGTELSGAFNRYWMST